MTTLNNSNNKRSMFGIEDVNADSIDTTNLICDTLVITTSGTGPTMPLATNTSNLATTAFVLANQAAETFQDVYDNSTSHPRPQIEISHANEALKIKGTGSIDNCLEILNTSETITASISHNGLITTALLPICSQVPSLDTELTNKLYVDTVAAGNLDDIISSSNSTAVTMYNNLTTGSVTMGANLTSGFLRIGSNASDLIVESRAVDMVNAELKCQTYNAAILNADMNIATNISYIPSTRANLTIGNYFPFTNLRGYTTSVVGQSVLTLKSNTNNVLIEGAGVNITTAGSISLNASSSTLTIPDININCTTLDINSTTLLNIASAYIKASSTTNICAQRAIAGAYMCQAQSSYSMMVPIFNSVSNYYDFYTPSIGAGSVTTGTSVSCNIPNQDDFYVVMPGYRLVVHTGINDSIVKSLDYNNLTSCPQTIQPTGYTHQGKSCQLYFNGVKILP